MIWTRIRLQREIRIQNQICDCKLGLGVRTLREVAQTDNSKTDFEIPNTTIVSVSASVEGISNFRGGFLGILFGAFWASKK